MTYRDFTDEDMQIASLIKASPMLLEAARGALDSLEYVNKNHPEATGWGVRAHRIGELRAAIASAEGRQP